MKCEQYLKMSYVDSSWPKDGVSSDRCREPYGLATVVVGGAYVSEIGKDETPSEFKSCVDEVVGLTLRVQFCKLKFTNGAEGPPALQFRLREQSVERVEAFRIASSV